MKRSLTDYPLAGKRVLVRVDFNVPLEDGRVADDTRIRAALPTITYLLDQGCPVVLMSRTSAAPRGRSSTGCAWRPWRRASRSCSAARSRPRTTASAPRPRRRRPRSRPGDVLLLENLRFHAEETGNDAGFAEQLAALGRRLRQRRLRHGSPRARLHRGRHALPALRGRPAHDQGARGPRPPAARPGAAVRGRPGRPQGLGQDQRSSGTCSTIADAVLIGGAMANAFLAAKGFEVGASRREPGTRSRVAARDARRSRARRAARLIIPTDVVVRARPVGGGAVTRRARRRHRRRRDGARHRPADHGRVRAPSSAGAGHDLLERARWACSRSRSSRPARAPSARPSPAASP